nr:hypothetical protein [Candidatus Njordarchaeota archaeon]
MKTFPKSASIFLLLLVFGFLILFLAVAPGEIFVSLFMSLLFLAAFYHLATHVSAYELRVRTLFWPLTVVFGFLVAFPFALVGAIGFGALLGLPRASLFVPLVFVGFAVGMVIGCRVGKKVRKDESEEWTSH